MGNKSNTPHNSHKSHNRLRSLELSRYNHPLWLLIYAVSPFVDTRSSSPDYDQGLPILHKNFEVIEVTGVGSYGEVFTAKHKHDGETYAIKCIPLNGVDGNTINEKREEVKILSSLKHKNVVSYKFSWIENEIPNADENNSSQQQSFCIQMEYCASTLAKFIGTETFRVANNKLDYFYQIVEGLAYVHSKGLVHADLHCDNILVDSDGCVKIADFGISFRASPDNESQYCQKGDVKDLGVILDQMFQGALLRTRGPLESSSYELADARYIFGWIQKPRSERPSCANLLAFRNTFSNVFNKAFLHTNWKPLYLSILTQLPENFDFTCIAFWESFSRGGEEFPSPRTNSPLRVRNATEIKLLTEDCSLLKTAETINVSSGFEIGRMLTGLVLYPYSLFKFLATFFLYKER